MQYKISAYWTLAEIGAPQPQTIAIANPAISGVSQPFPFIIKRPISPASLGVRRAKTPDELVIVATQF
jgi:glutathione synthase/RimK-type ligase-like ATP-grasp enzyme